MNGKYAKLFGAMEIDAIGEIMNISLGSSATAISTLLDRRVDITTPTVEIVAFDEFEFSALEPAVAVEITYIAGLHGTNIMVLKKSDVRQILQILMQMEVPEEEFTMDEMATSAICEVMNQMMGASSTALSEFLGEIVNISTPISFEIDDTLDFKRKYFEDEKPMAVISFRLSIENCMDSEFITMMSTDLVKKIIAASGFGDFGYVEEADEPEIPEEAMMTPGAPPIQQQQPAPIPAAAAPIPEQPVQQQPQPQAAPVQQPVYQAPPVQQPAPMPVYQAVPEEPKVIHVEPRHKGPSVTGFLPENQGENLDMIMSVPLQVSVEIGRARKSVKEIVDFTQGTLVVLDKLAGDQVDIFVNGQKIAKGDVVVVDDCFGVKITEILKDGLSLPQR